MLRPACDSDSADEKKKRTPSIAEIKKKELSSSTAVGTVVTPRGPWGIASGVVTGRIDKTHDARYTVVFPDGKQRP